MSTSIKTCPCCRRNRVGPIRTWRRLSMYTDNRLNYLTVCVHCIREDDYDFAHLWADYYSSQGHYHPVDYRKRNAKEWVVNVKVDHIPVHGMLA